MTKSQIDKLGERLRAGPAADPEKRLLDEYRTSFTVAYEQVMGALAEQFKLAPTGRIKSNASILDKLRRQPKMALSRMQDIAGCRIVVDDILAQNATVEDLVKQFQHIRIVDRRHTPSHGYRAAHIIVDVASKPIEIQVRTALQQLWAESSEKLSDAFDPAIKYGSGPTSAGDILSNFSTRIAQFESEEQRTRIAIADMDEALSGRKGTGDAERARIAMMRRDLEKSFSDTIALLIKNLEP
jgi:putative GTP pyrophosphokinase